MQSPPYIKLLIYNKATTLERHVLELAEQRILKQPSQSYMNFLREDEIQYLDVYKRQQLERDDIPLASRLRLSFSLNTDRD